MRVLLPAESREESSAVALVPPSEFSLGICTFNCGRFDWPLFVRVGGIISLEREDIDWVRDVSVTARGGGGGGISGGLVVAFDSFWSSWVESNFTPASLRSNSLPGGMPDPKWRASTDPRSSIGVNMLRDLDERDLW